MSLIVNQSTSALLEADLVDETDAAVAGSALDSAVLSLTSAEDGSVINSRTNVNILAYIDTAGHLAFPLTALDTVLLNDLAPSEWRDALIVIVWNGGTKQLTQRIAFQVRRVS